MWFEKLTGFREESPDQVRANLCLEGSKITSRVNGRRMEAGVLEICALAQLRTQAIDDSTGGAALTGAALTIEEIVADVRDLHTIKDAQGALFQVASQFNLLEMASPSLTPDDGITIYSHDPTQGPACAIAAGAGTILRNYFVPVNGQVGQSAHSQIDCLESVGNMLGNTDERLWSMKNGYALATMDGLQELNKRLLKMDDGDRDTLRGALRIGLQWNTEVTIDDCGQLVSQAYCSALPVAYSSYPAKLWREFARLILEAAYEATLAAAVINHAQTGNRRVFLTLLGGGAFGNASDWILDAIKRALHLYRRYPLDVKIVSHGAPDPRIRELTG